MVKGMLCLSAGQSAGGRAGWICGANGSGKTTLLELLTGRHRIAQGEMKYPGFASPEEFHSSVTLVRRDFSLNQVFSRSAVFYQQRYFSQGLEETPPVIDFLAGETGISEDTIRTASREAGFDHLLDKRIVSLSTGEGRRILLLMLRLSGRKIICFDDPYAGLDSEGCDLVSSAFASLMKKMLASLQPEHQHSLPQSLTMYCISGTRLWFLPEERRTSDHSVTGKRKNRV
jgi:molybdate transport system ATP-binding protein